MAYDDVEDEDDDLFLSDFNFVKEWLPRVCRDLKSVSISDFWVQSCWRRTDVLSLISSYCELHSLVSWLSTLFTCVLCYDCSYGYTSSCEVCISSIGWKRFEVETSLKLWECDILLNCFLVNLG